MEYIINWKVRVTKGKYMGNFQNLFCVITYDYNGGCLCNQTCRKICNKLTAIPSRKS